MRNVWGYINTRGENVIDIKYGCCGQMSEQAGDFRSGFAAVSTGENQVGLIDKKGNTIVPFEYGTIVYAGKDGGKSYTGGIRNPAAFLTAGHGEY
jgi:hypothetical protein